MNKTIVLEGTLTKVTSARAQKAELTIGKVEVCFQVRDPEQVGYLTMLQNGIVRVTIEDPQIDMYEKMMRDEQEGDGQASMDFGGAEDLGEDVDGAFRPLLPGHKEEAADSDLGEVVTAEELEEN